MFCLCQLTHWSARLRCLAGLGRHWQGSTRRDAWGCAGVARRTACRCGELGRRHGGISNHATDGRLRSCNPASILLLEMSR